MKLIQAFETGQLFNNSQGIDNAARRHVIPDFIDFGFNYTGDHLFFFSVSHLFFKNLTDDKQNQEPPISMKRTPPAD